MVNWEENSRPSDEYPPMTTPEVPVGPGRTRRGRGKKWMVHYSCPDQNCKNDSCQPESCRNLNGLSAENSHTGQDPSGILDSDPDGAESFRSIDSETWTGEQFTKYCMGDPDWRGDGVSRPLSDEDQREDDVWRVVKAREHDDKELSELEKRAMTKNIARANKERTRVALECRDAELVPQAKASVEVDVADGLAQGEEESEDGASPQVKAGSEGRRWQRRHRSARPAKVNSMWFMAMGLQLDPEATARS